MEPYSDFYEAEEERANDRVVGLVFPRKGIRHGLIMYASDDHLVLPFSKQEFYQVYVGGTRKAQHRLYIRSFQKVVEAIHNGGHGWRPE